MASGPITSWQIDGETTETLTDFIFLGSKVTTVTAAVKLRRLLPAKLESILKGRDSNCADKGRGLNLAK